MLTLLIFLIVAFILSRVDKRNNDWHSFADTIIFMWIGFLIGVLIVFIGGIVVSAVAESEEFIVGTREIVAFKDNNSTSGSFFLGSGYVDGDMKYCAMIKNEDGSYEMKTYDTDECLIIETNDTPKIEKRGYCFKTEWLNWFFFNMKLNEYVFYIPEGSICNNYVVDLE